MSVVPVNIRPHLAAYLFREMDGEELVYLGRTVKAAKIPMSSSLGRTMRMVMVNITHPLPVKPDDQFQVYLSVEDDPVEGKHYHGNYYKFESGSRSWLAVPPGACEEFNNLLEDIFRANFVSFMEGYMLHPAAVINDGINIWIDKYDLLETGFSTESFRQLYYREKKKGRLNRLQERPSNRVLNYK